MDEPKPEESKADHGYMSRKVKSELFHIWKKARTMYDMVGDDDAMEGWVKERIRVAYEALDEASRYTEYDRMFPPEDAEEPKGENNFLSNEDKRYPTPVESEGGDQFITRCITDSNMKSRYPESSDRFAACMLVYNDSKSRPLTDAPGEKFEDPMAPKEEELRDPQKPILP